MNLSTLLLLFSFIYCQEQLFSKHNKES